MKFISRTIPTPVGELRLVASDKGLAAILWQNDDPKRVRILYENESRPHPVLTESEKQLGEYFKGLRKTFSLDLDPYGTSFQKQVWQALIRIPYGQTKSYGELAKEIGNPSASRAVGAANGKNPISIVVPCHRVIGASGKLTGFAGGLDIKARLLALEAETDAR